MSPLDRPGARPTPTHLALAFALTTLGSCALVNLLSLCLSREAMTYKVSAIAATALFIFIAIVATYLRFEWHLEEEGDFPWDEMAATLLLVFGGMVG